MLCDDFGSAVHDTMNVNGELGGGENFLKQRQRTNIGLVVDYHFEWILVLGGHLIFSRDSATMPEMF